MADDQEDQGYDPEAIDEDEDDGQAWRRVGVGSGAVAAEPLPSAAWTGWLRHAVQIAEPCTLLCSRCLFLIPTRHVLVAQHKDPQKEQLLFLVDASSAAFESVTVRQRGCRCVCAAVDAEHASPGPPPYRQADLGAAL